MKTSFCGNFSWEKAFGKVMVVEHIPRIALLTPSDVVIQRKLINSDDSFKWKENAILRHWCRVFFHISLNSCFIFS
jgi:hypothetical protein